MPINDWTKPTLIELTSAPDSQAGSTYGPNEGSKVANNIYDPSQPQFT
ncbi:MAG: hypothetical protein RI958_2647 [Actinomycetota bacterium]|jgi:hypothetical protein